MFAVNNSSSKQFLTASTFILASFRKPSAKRKWWMWSSLPTQRWQTPKESWKCRKPPSIKKWTQRYPVDSTGFHTWENLPECTKASPGFQKAEAQLAYELQAAKEQQKIRLEEIEIEVVQRKKQITIEEKEIDRTEKELIATVKRPAEAEAYKMQQLAEGQKWVLRSFCRLTQSTPLFIRHRFQQIVAFLVDFVSLLTEASETKETAATGVSLPL